MGHALTAHHPGHAHPLEADERLQRALAPGHRPRRHRHPDGGRARAQEDRGQEPPRPRPRGVPRARLGVEGEVRQPDRRAAQGAGRLARLGRASASRWTRGSRARCARSFVRLHEEGLIYRAQQLINWCPRCHTALSDLEVEHEEKNGALWHIALPGEGHGPSARPSPPPARRRCSATPRSRCTPTTRATRDLIGKKVRAPAPRPRDPDHRRRGAGRHGVRHRRGEGHPGARLQRLRRPGLRHKLPMISILDESARTNEEAGAVRRARPLRGAQEGARGSRPSAGCS